MTDKSLKWYQRWDVRILIISGLFTALGWFVQHFGQPVVNNYIQEQAEIQISKSIDSSQTLEAKIAKDLNCQQKDVHIYMSAMFENTQWLQDSVKKFREDYYPTLQQWISEIQIGEVYVGGRVFWRHYDGQLYSVHKDYDLKKRYFRDANDRKRFLYD